MRRGIVIALAALALLPVRADAHAVPGARGGEPIATRAAPSERVAARVRFFGAGNVDPRTGAIRKDRVLLTWFGVTNFAMAVRGHVVLLDAWVPRGTHSGYVPTTPAELAALGPEYIVLGHAHFDHAADAVPIAQASGATLVGTGEHCLDLKGRGAVSCIDAVPVGAPPGTTRDVALVKGLQATVLKHVHSGTEAPAGSPHLPVTPQPSTTSVEHPVAPADLVEFLGHLPDSEGGTLLWRFRLGGFTLVWHDSSGPLPEKAPGVLDQLRALGPVDVELGAIQGFDQFTNGMRDPMLYLDAIHAATFVPTHMDDWAPPVSTHASYYRPFFDAAVSELPPDRRPRKVIFPLDPADYVRPGLLDFDAELEPLRLTRVCRDGRLKVRLRGDRADVTGVRITRTRRQVRAVVTDYDGVRHRLVRSRPRC
jgi:L-ascorbate metabolism protein UlaG (beta-lactamase superfamily)